MRTPLPPPVIFTIVSAFQRRTPAHFVRFRTGAIAMSAITRVFAETASQRTDRLGEMRRSCGEPFSRSPLMYNVSSTTLVGS